MGCRLADEKRVVNSVSQFPSMLPAKKVKKVCTSIRLVIEIYIQKLYENSLPPSLQYFPNQK